MKNFLLMCVVLTAVVAFSAKTASACSCLPSNPKLTEKQQVMASLKDSGAVFTAKIVAVKNDDQARQQITYTIEVIRVWKGKVSKTTTISTGSNSAMCGYSFTVGETYLIYAGDGGKDGFFTNHCTRTDNLVGNADIKHLGKGRKAKRV